MSGLQVTARGYVNTWQCDENAHLNVQFFTAFAFDASQHVMASLGFDSTVRARTGLRIAVAEDQVRYYRELQAADSIIVRSAPVEVHEKSLAAYHEIRNAYDGELATTVRSVLNCETQTGDAAPLPSTVRERALVQTITLPEVGQPRSTGKLERPVSLNLSNAAQRGFFEVVRNTVSPHECDGDGRLLPQFIIGRNSDGAGSLWHQLGFDRAEMRARNQGTVVMEMRQVFTPGLKAGDLAVVMSGMVSHTNQVLHLVHCLFDGESGELAAFSEASAGLFDLEGRALVAFGDEKAAPLDERLARIDG